MIVGCVPPFLSAGVALVLGKGIPAALYDIEMNAPGIPAFTRSVFSAEATDCGTFCH